MLNVKKLEGHAVHAETEAAELAVLKVLSGQGLGASEPAGQYEPAGQGVRVHAATPVRGE